MSSDAPETGHDEGECTTTESFADHDIDDGSALIERTYHRLTDGDRTAFEPTVSFYDALESAFMWAYLGTVEEAGIPHTSRPLSTMREPSPRKTSPTTRKPTCGRT
jgi:hypothetical protein